MAILPEMACAVVVPAKVVLPELEVKVPQFTQLPPTINGDVLDC